MRVLLINAVCGAGSTGKICSDIADALLTQGHEVLILYGNGSSPYAHANRVGSGLSVKMNALYARVSGYTAHGCLTGTRQIMENIKRFQPDVVHLHNLHANYVNTRKLLQYLGENDVATVITLHDCWMFTGKCTHYHAIGCTKWQTGCQHCAKRKDDVPSLFFDRTRSMWQEKKDGFSKIRRLGVIGVSDWITEQARQSFLADATIIRRIYNWIDLNTFMPPQAGGMERDKFTVLCASASWSKNSDRFRDLLELAQKLEPSMELMVAGTVECPEQLPATVKCIGYIRDQQTMASVFASAGVYVHLSREDTFGKVIAEAIACGTPAIVYDSTACPEIVREGTGYTVPVGDIDSIVHCCQVIRSNGKSSYLKRCRSSAEERFDQARLLEDTIELYKELMAK